MSEKIYALLLRLYPAQFRKRYGEEALQLLRDRLRDEAGFPARLRLWLDMVADLAISVPREHRALRSALAPAAPALRADGMPSFRVLEEEPPRPATLMVAGLLSAAGLVAFFVLINIAGARFVSRAAQQQAPPATTAPARPAALTAEATSGGGNPADAATAAAGKPGNPRAGSSDQSVSIAALDPAERHRVVTAVADDLSQFYFDREKGQQAAGVVLRQERLGADRAATTGSLLATLLTGQIRGATDDLHLIVEYSAPALPKQPGTALSPDGLARYRALMHETHCTIEKVAVLPGNVGYIKLNSFPEPAVCEPQIRQAMGSIDNTAAVIFDLRDNRGGDPAMTALIAAYLFPKPVYWYNPRGATAAESWLSSPVSGSRLTNKPVYILTSVLTLSGAEQFSYDLKMLHRATLVGETTGGAAHAGVFHRIDDHFGIGIPEVRVVNPYSRHDWEVVGVTPDVRVQPAQALVTAQRLAQAARNGAHTASAQR